MALDSVHIVVETTGNVVATVGITVLVTLFVTWVYFKIFG